MKHTAKNTAMILVLLFVLGCSFQQSTQKFISSTMEAIEMKLTSPAFMEGEKIPSNYSCDGQNINPPLSFSDVPAKAGSLVLIMDDPDIPNSVKQKFGIQVWEHWIVFNIPPETREVAEGKNPSGILGKNTGGKNAYGGPCPPDREHRYLFKLYALDAKLDLPEGSSKAEVESAMKGHILAEAKLMGRYERKK